MQSEKNAAQAGGNSVSINLWYGREQQFGHAGTPQRFVNILGCVAGPDKISKLTFSLNGGMPIQTSVGPNKRRLQNNGDFNIDILVDDLKDGRNIVHIEAADEKGRRPRPESGWKLGFGATCIRSPIRPAFLADLT